MGLAPLLRQLAGGGGGEDGLAKALEDGRHAVEAFATSVHLRKDCIELVGDALLLVKRREAQLAIKDILLRYALLTNRPTHYLLPVSQKLWGLEVR
jgi:hypothetical protein